MAERKEKTRQRGEGPQANQWHDSWRELGGLWPLGVPIGQNWLELGAVLYAIQQYEVARCLEIGSGQGGLAAVLAARTIFSWKPFEAMTTEIDGAKLVDPVTLAALERVPGMAVHYMDCFSERFLLMAREFIGRPGVCFVYCDGGAKAREVQLYAPLLKSGDLIGAHDWSPGNAPRNASAEINDVDLAALGGGYERLNPWWLEGTQICLLRRR